MAAEDKIATLVIQFEAQTATLQKQLKRVDTLNKRTERQFRRTASATKTLSSAFRALAPLIGGAALARGVRELVSFGSEIVQVSERIGFTTDELQALRAEGDAVGISFATTDMALQRFSRRVGEAQAGSGELKATLDELGIDPSGKTLGEVFDEFAASVRNAESDQDALRLAFKAFDSEGARFVTVIRQAGFSLDEATEQARQLGFVLDNDAAQALERFGTASSAAFLRMKVAASELVGGVLEDVFLLWDQILSATNPSAFDDRTEAIVRQNQAIADQSALLNRLNPLIRSLDTEYEKFLGDVDILQDSFEAGLLTLERYNDLMQRLGERLQKTRGDSRDLKIEIDETSDAMVAAGERVSSGFADELAKALVTGEANFRRFAQAIIADLGRIAVRQAIVNSLAGLTSGISGSQLGNLGHIFAKGGAYNGSNVIPLARGGIINQPTLLAGGAAIGGEAGPEGVLPLKRTASGDLGVQVAGGGAGFAPNVTVNMNGPVGDSTQAGQAIGAEVTRQMGQWWVMESRNQRRPGGALNPVA